MRLRRGAIRRLVLRPWEPGEDEAPLFQRATAHGQDAHPPGAAGASEAQCAGFASHLAPVPHSRFDGLATLDEVDRAVADWRDAVRDGSAFSGPWPAFVNIPSKIGQVAAVRALAKRRREDDLARDALIASVCPGMMNTPASRARWDVDDAPTPDEAAGPLLELVLDPVNPEQYGELAREGRIAPWHGRIVPWHPAGVRPPAPPAGIRPPAAPRPVRLHPLIPPHVTDVTVYGSPVFRSSYDPIAADSRGRSRPGHHSTSGGAPPYTQQGRGGA
ncbi:hypothetical protein [Streptomyces iranensis]|uniref:hypothetical protein n=1 Tax=Streptomyces iranensis TaxID=576784 RepID=UPI0039B776C6